MDLVVRVVREAAHLFASMAPYILFGLATAGLLSVTVSRSFVARHLGNNSIGSALKAAIFGVPLPLCSCSVVPTATYFRKSGASRSAVVSFLISTPQTGVDSIAATYGMLGPLFAVVRPAAALVSGLIGGAVSLVLGPARSGTSIDASAEPTDHEAVEVGPVNTLNWSERLRRAWSYAAIESVDDLTVQFLLGVVIGGGIAVLLPADFFLRIGLDQGILAMLAMIAIGAPMYICATSSIPIALALIAKGLSPGAAYVFLVAGPATNLATLLILSAVIGKRDTIVFMLTVLISSLAFGFAVDGLVNLTGWAPPISAAAAGHKVGVVGFVSAGAFGILIVWALLRRVGRRRRLAAAAVPTHPEDHAYAADSGRRTVLSVSGMTCAQCETSVEDAVRLIGGTERIVADHGAGSVVIDGSVATADTIRAIRDIGFEARVATDDR